MKTSKKTALSAVMAALGVALLYIGSLVDVLDISTACIASIAVLFCLTEMGLASALGVYAVVTTLSLLILPQKMPALLFAIFFGLLPITKMLFEKLGAKTGVVISYILKLALFNGELVLFGFLAKGLLDLPKSTALIILYIALSNAVFVLLDILYGRLIKLYFGKIRKKISKFLK